MISLRSIGAVLLAAATMLAPAVAQTRSAPSRDAALVTTEWLERNLDNPRVRIVEVSVVPGLFERGHIQGAQNVSWHTDLVETVTRDIASRDRFEALVRRLGIERDTTVVLYGDNNNWFAAWAAWIFEIYGLGENVRLLDGGRRKWEADRRGYTTRVAAVRPSTISITEPNLALRARLNDVLAVVRSERPGVVLDIRSPDEFAGRIIAPEGVQELAIRAGHIPGSVNVPWAQAVNADGTIKSTEELRRLYGAVGIDGSRPVITTCRIGERSSHTWFVLSRLLGYEVRNYDGSWTEYGNTVGVPITNPAGTVWGGR